VACDDVVVGSHQHRIRPAKFRCGNLVDLSVAMGAGVSLVGLQPFDWSALHLDVDVC
jgi:hypothetical protein